MDKLLENEKFLKSIVNSSVKDRKKIIGRASESELEFLFQVIEECKLIGSFQNSYIKSHVSKFKKPKKKTKLRALFIKHHKFLVPIITWILCKTLTEVFTYVCNSI